MHYKFLKKDHSSAPLQVLPSQTRDLSRWDRAKTAEAPKQGAWQGYQLCPTIASDNTRGPMAPVVAGDLVMLLASHELEFQILLASQNGRETLRQHIAMICSKGNVS